MASKVISNRARQQFAVLSRMRRLLPTLLARRDAGRSCPAMAAALDRFLHGLATLQAKRRPRTSR